MNTISNSNSLQNQQIAINPTFQETKISNAGSVDSGIEVIDTAYSRTKKRVMRPPSASGGNQESTSNQ